MKTWLEEHPRITVALPLVASGALICVALGTHYWATRTRPVAAQVVTMSWTRWLHRQTFTQVEAEDWRDDIYEAPSIMPVNGAGEQAGAFGLHDCHDKYHHTDHFPCGIYYTFDGHGHSESHTRWCDEPVYKTWCAYETYKWTGSGETKAEGEGTANIDWPKPPAVLALDKIVPEERYRVTSAYKARNHFWSHDDDTEPALYELNPSYDAYLTWSVGDASKLRVSNMGSVDSCEHATVVKGAQLAQVQTLAAPELHPVEHR